MHFLLYAPQVGPEPTYRLVGLTPAYYILISPETIRAIIDLLFQHFILLLTVSTFNASGVTFHENHFPQPITIGKPRLLAIVKFKATSRIRRNADVITFCASRFQNMQRKGFYIDLAVSHPIKAFFLAAPQRY